ncbi:RDD family protein [Pseudomonas boanensis]|uniref:RDD family protein n=1 Tax=Metapseudomonas boanensis TaxID=2822138 RepID=A0ABS5XDN3_9GAMM|nr:RDD family protein [Pseudomonas boanensis]MBT8765306.1 RDD family protein [Pseudomonas boanensis]
MENLENPYQAPQAELTLSTAEPLLASRGTRLGAALIDGLIMSLTTLPVAFFSGAFEAAKQGLEPTLGQQLLGLVVGLVAFVLINGHFLNQYGQTVGKRVLKIAIIGLQGEKPELAGLIVKRYLIWWLVAYIPLVGALLVLVNYLFIFRGDRRCLHDLTAGTRVVQLPG